MMKIKTLCFLLLVVMIFFSACTEKTKNQLSLVETVDLSDAISYYEGFDRGGNTSIAFDATSSFKWSGKSVAKSGGFGYFLPDGTEIPYIKRDRDLGQTFTFKGETPRKWTGLTLKLGFGSNVIRRGTYGSAIAIQFFEVSGTPILNENGTTGDMTARHGYPHDPESGEMDSRRDDYWEGEIYTSLGFVQGFQFPSKDDFGFAENSDISPDDESIKGQLIHFSFSPSDQILLEPDKTYAFLVMLAEMGDDVGFTLANHFDGDFPDGHGIRRDGRGVFPPPAADPSKPFDHLANAKALESARFPQDLSDRIKISPGTNGYPDVDTWRDVYFVVHGNSN